MIGIKFSHLFLLNFRASPVPCCILEKYILKPFYLCRPENQTLSQENRLFYLWKMEYKRLDNEGLYSFRKGIKEQKSTYMEVIVLLKRLATPLQIQRILKINPEMLEFFI